MNDNIKNDKWELSFDFFVKSVIETETPKKSYTPNFIIIC